MAAASIAHVHDPVRITVGVDTHKESHVGHAKKTTLVATSVIWRSGPQLAAMRHSSPGRRASARSLHSVSRAPAVMASN